MLFSDFCKILDKIEKTTKRLEKTDYFVELIDFIKNSGKPENLKQVSQITIGRVFAEFENKEIGIGPNLLLEAVKTTGILEKDLKSKIKETGDIGTAVENLSSNIKQVSLFSQALTLEEVYSTLKKLSEIEGNSSQKKKTRIISNLLILADPVESRYISRLILEDMRIGMNIPTILASFSNYFNVNKESVEKIYAVTNDIGLLGEKLISGSDIENDPELKLKVFRPIKPMLAQLTPSIEDAMIETKMPQFETKYDGARVQVHKSNGNVKIYSRRLENITNSVPELVEEIKKLDIDNIILEGECVAMDLDSGKPRPFQDILRRFRRKYNIDKMAEKIALRIYFFDVLYYSRGLIDTPLKTRREILEKLFGTNNWDSELEKIKKEIFSNKMLFSSFKLNSDDPNLVKEFFNWSLSIGHEGIMIKNPDAPYTPGSRVKTMYKVKPTLENLDVVVTRAKIGMGKRKDWYGSYELSVKDNDSNLHVIGNVGSGLTEDDLEKLTKIVNEIKIEDLGEEVILEPKIVLEVTYEEIQTSEKYEMGYALRFPRVVQIREDKSINDINTLDDVKKIYEIERNRK
ncbi:ATP-dependent DNA ligase [Methanococcus maripaludis]|uniref:DNA ligase n=1 Tax=Methanococcus maripaludis TaxID=39152 RepID=A0A8T4H2A1_METMI|nr:ATP-dependent DNA ligase [Methanococcus maripaludis]MBM7409002.1 DNA ligase-1 [Methanococcus maripaludis]MBP2218812.1 DNA ligase-1 [Methanococcus maripaludis]